MAKLGQYRNSTETTKNPTSVYLDSIKWELGVWNKDLWKNIFHKLNKFIILSVGFTIQWKVWNDQIKKYTNTYYSNEIRQFNETIYAIDMVFNNGKAEKTLVAKWNWKTEVKSHLPQWVGIKAMITVLDLDDGIVKCFPVSASQYFGDKGLAKDIESWEPTDILKYEITKMYTNGTKDKEGNEIMITEKALDEMKWSEASKYKNRYLSKLTKVSEGDQESIESAEDLVDAVDEYYKSKKEYYAKTYGVVDNAPAGEYAKPEWIQSDEDFANDVKAEAPVMDAKGKTQEHNSSADLDANDLPF